MSQTGPGRALAVIIVLISSAVAIAQTPPPTEPLTLEAALQRAVTANPTVAAARLRRTAALREVDVARERLNPEARVEFERETPTRAYSLAVPLETGGKRARRIAVGEAAVQTSEAEVMQVIAE